jgi:rhodanese-related sulfurtransferase
MSFFAENWILLLVAFVSGAMLVWPMVSKGGGAQAVSPNEAVRQINREKGVLIDVSEPNEFAAGHAIGAKNVPFGKVEEPKQLPSNKALPILLLCPTGARAGRAAALLRKAGYEKAVAVAGGTNAWRDAGLPVEKSAEAEAGTAGKGGKADEKAAGKGNDRNAGKQADKADEKSAA